MHKISIFSFIIVAFAIVFVSSCKKSDNSIYFYSESRDTIAPLIKTSVPLSSDFFGYGEDIHIVGNVTDLETIKTSGKLKSLRIDVYQMNATFDTIKNTTPVLLKTPNVDGKDGYTFNEKMLINFGVEPTYYKLTVTTYDYSGRSDVDVRTFTIQ